MGTLISKQIGGSMRTNYDRLLNPTIEEMAKNRTKCISYSFGYTYQNDAGVFRPSHIDDDPYEDAIKAEIEWLNCSETL